MDIKTLDSYSILIASKYLEKSQDFINLICVCKKFKETTEKLRFNPISIESLKLFPRIQTQNLYDKIDKKIEGIVNYEIWYKIDYCQYLEYKEENIKCHNVIYSHKNRLQYGNEIPEEVNILGDNCFGCNLFSDDASTIQSIKIPTTIKSLGWGCFSECCSLKVIDLQSTITSLDDYCFCNCHLLTSINLPLSLTSLRFGLFYNCWSLKSINLPSNLRELEDECFKGCYSLTSIDLPLSLTLISNYCFEKCTSLQSIKLPSTIREFGLSCFSECSKLTTIPNIPEYCFTKKM
ncbi:Leucine rich repeat protein bspa family [Entamoeba marina]